MPSLCQTELHHIDQQLKSLLAKLTDMTQSERHDVLQTLERAIYQFVDRVDALAHSPLLKTGT
jgi:hypothetical protein